MKEYLRADASISEEVQECVTNLEKLKDPDIKETTIVNAICHLEKLAIREKNEDITDLGCVKAIIACAKDLDKCYCFNGQQKIGIKQECAPTVTRFANSEKNGTKVANQVTTKDVKKQQSGVIIDTETKSNECCNNQIIFHCKIIICIRQC